MYLKPPIYTLRAGNAWGGAALLLAAGSKGNQACLPSASITINQVLHQLTLSPTDFDSLSLVAKKVSYMCY
jgi:ATP-dependent Clp protease protease subunit